MSKIGRKPIDIGNIQVEVKNSVIHYKGKKASGTYRLPPQLQAQLKNKQLVLLPVPSDSILSDINALWGLHRALLANELKGADQPFEKQLRIVGLGFKAVITGNKVQFSLGFSHKIDRELPQGVTIEADKTGQLLTVRSIDKDNLGLTCSEIIALRPPEPYKGTGIHEVGTVIRRKAGKAKAAK